MPRTISLDYEHVICNNLQRGALEFIATMHNHFVILIYSPRVRSQESTNKIIENLQEYGLQRKVVTGLIYASEHIAPCAIVRGSKFMPHCPCMQNIDIQYIRSQPEFVKIQRTLFHILHTCGTGDE